MMIRILVFTLLAWTQAQAYQNSKSSSSYSGSTYEVTYEELAQELSMKRKEPLPETEVSLLGMGQGGLAIGYTFSALSFQLPSGSKSFSQNGLDVRYLQAMTNSDWTFEGGFKNYGSTSTGATSAEGKSVSAMAKMKNPMGSGRFYTMALGSSINWSKVRELSKRREATDWALNLKAGLLGSISKRFAWQVEAGTVSPLSSEILKGGFETSLLISSEM